MSGASDEIDQAADALEDSDEGVTSTQRSHAFYYFVGAFALIIGTLIGGAGLLWSAGMLSFNLSLTGSVDIGAVIEQALTALVWLFVLSIGAAILIWLPGSFLGGVTRALGYFAEGYREVQRRDDQ